LLGLNYFNILPVSRVFPFLSFLPTQTLPKPTEKPTVTSLTKVICPVKEDFCDRGAMLILPARDNAPAFSGIVYDNLPDGTEVFAVRAGDIEVKTNDAGNTIISIINKENRLLINYEFPKDALKQNQISRAVKEGESIGSIIDAEKIFPNLGGSSNLILSIQDFDTKSYFRITTSKDKKFIEPI
jgi:hypothetical protein